MKLPLNLFITSLLFSGIVFGEPVIEETSTDNTIRITTLSNAEVEAYMNAMIVQDFSIDRVQLITALEQLDEIVAPFGLQILFLPDASKSKVVTLKTRDLTMAKNLSYLCRQVGYDWWVDEGVVVVGFPGSNEAMVTDIIPLKSTMADRFKRAGGLL